MSQICQGLIPKPFRRSIYQSNKYINKKNKPNLSWIIIIIIIVL